MSQEDPSAPALTATLLTNLVSAVIPSTRKSRGVEESLETAEGRRKLRVECVALAEEIFNSDLNQPSSSSEREVIARLKRKLTSYAVDGGHGSGVKLQNLVQELRALPNQGKHAALLELLDRLAFSNLPSSSASAASEGRSDTRSEASRRPTDRPSSAATGASRPSVATRPVSGATRNVSSATTATTASRATLSSRPAPGGPGTTGPSSNRPSSTVTGSREATPQARPRADVRSAERNNAVAAKAPAAREQGPAALPAHDSRFAAVPNAPQQPPATHTPCSRAELVRRCHAKFGKEEVPETDLIKDVVYLLQGINGTYVGFEEVLSPASNEIGAERQAEKELRMKWADDKGRISPQTKHLIHRIAEVGRLYRRMAEFVKDHNEADVSGLIEQSLCHFINEEMTEYLRLLAILEAHMHRSLQSSALANMDRGRSPNDVDALEESSKGTTTLTLRRIWLWTEDVVLKMRLLSTVIASTAGAHGGQLVSRIHSYTFNGDPFIRSYTARLLEEVSRPFFYSLSRWIYEGELHDPFGEFFVELNESSALQGAEALDVDAFSLWQSKFRIRTEMLPSFLKESFAQMIFSTGRSLNFIRYSCGDIDWASTKDTIGSTSADLRYTDLSGLESTINSAYSTASQHLLDILLEKFRLLDHLRALKDYLMLGRGDFVDHLLEAVAPYLDKPASSLYRHNLTASLETAIRNSNAQYDDPDIVARLDARILEYSSGDTGWDTFQLEYKCESPVNAVLDTEAMIGYQTVFAHLWKLRRTESAVGSAWAKLMAASRMLPRGARASGGLQRLLAKLRSALLGLSEMIHFVRQVQGFCQLEVIDYSWQDLMDFFATRKGDLDELILEHRRYLNALKSKALLLSQGKRGGDALAKETKAQLDTILAGAAACNDLATWATDELARAELSRPLGPSSRRRPVTPVARAPQGRSEENMDRIIVRFQSHMEEFRGRNGTIIVALSKHSNLVFRGLATRLGYDAKNPATDSESRTRRNSGATVGTHRDR
ncbi:hypothetical protein IE81DRAFT_325973 [Ceraceosorus guamensis]|uniref:Uncharacterized protein n=1 Tax=Ceraceosorus guamensis TaxID=1522189 RepID=A0A316VQR8_9BASI|nr:hypothetical protein IE81DRAFT_325973 [Ceraceosorus guamensis]PWN39999.1 hypothetical protein IE81DRAFT_325973 [Ceraceosorus guamensis]